ncbi:MAG: two-component system LytT family response regulator [Bacteroidia bacterium]|jgi:two-component system LytT family response regulator
MLSSYNSKPLGAVLIEDEAVSRETLHNYLAKYCPNVEILAHAENIQEGAEMIKKHQPNLVFLDVEMPYGNGFDLLENLPKIDFEVVFVTAFSQYALKAINMSAAYYLLKPIEIDELIASVEKVSVAIEQKNRLPIGEILKSNLQTTDNQLKKIVLPEMDGFEVVQLKDIIYCAANDNLTDFFLEDGQKKTVCKTLKHFDELLVESGFLRIHKSTLVNINHIKGYKKGKGGYAVMNSGKELEIALRRKAEFMSVFNR